MNKEDLLTKILEWEKRNEIIEDNFFEAFCEYYIDYFHWAFWLLGKGFHDEALRIIIGCDQMDIDHVFELFTDKSDNLELLIEYIIASNFYTDELESFFAEFEDEEELL